MCTQDDTTLRVCLKEQSMKNTGIYKLIIQSKSVSTSESTQEKITKQVCFVGSSIIWRQVAGCAPRPFVGSHKQEEIELFFYLA
jgi:hypothetical protein